MLLSGLAYDTWKNLTVEKKKEIKDADAIKTALRNAFRMSRLDAWRQVQSKKVHVGDSIDAIGDKISMCINVAVAGSDPLEYVKEFILLEALTRSVKIRCCCFLETTSHTRGC